MEYLIQIALSLATTCGAGIFFWGYLKRREKSKTEVQESEARKAIASADVAEDSAFSQRIAFLSEQVRQSNEDAERNIAKIRELNAHIDELENNVRDLSNALSKANKLIEEKEECIKNLEEELRLQIEKNEIYAKRKSHAKSEVTRMRNNDEKKAN